MFWHGSNFMHRYTWFMILNTNKTSVFGMCLLMYQPFCDLSGLNVVPDPFFIFFSFTCAQIGFYIYFEQVVSQERYKEKEENMPFKLSAHYRMVK